MLSLLPRHHAVPGTIWTLGFVSLLMDLSSELVHSLLPLFLVSTLGASMLSIGLLEGVAEATALIVKIFSGALSDYLGRRKGLLLLGYGLAALTKPLFPLAHSIEAVFVARFVDRIGKGIRGAPRDALVADVAPPAIRGACFGLRQSMDTIGAFLGPLLAIVLMFWLNDLQSVLWVAVLPAILVVILLLRLKEPTRSPETRPFRSPIQWRAWRRFTRGYWWVVAVGGLFTLARFSEAFLILRAQQVGLTTPWVPLVMVVMSLCYTLSAYPAGWLSDHLRRAHVLAMGLLLLIAADLLLGTASSVPLMLCGAALWGVHMGFSQGVLATLIADTSPAPLKGTAFGLFNLVCGVCMLLASVLAGALWQWWGAAITFYAGAGFSMLALLLLGIQPLHLQQQR
jgi:MFS family permease